MFNKIKATNFMSWEDLEFDFQSGVTLISGFNQDDGTSEGSGKSAILNALCWGLYGKIPKNTNIDDVIRDGQKNCSVELEIGPYTIARIRNPKKNDLYIALDSVKSRGKDAKETQKMIEDLIGLSYDAFTQSVYFAQNYPKKFVTASEEDKVKIISEIQSLQVFDKARKNVMVSLRSENITLITLEKDLEKVGEMAGALSEQVSDLEVLKTLFENEKKQNIKNLKTEADELEDLIKEKTEELDSLNVEAAEKLVEELNSDIEALEEEKSGLKASLLNIDNDKRARERIQKSIARLRREMEDLDDEVAAMEKPETKYCPLCKSKLTKKAEKHFRDHIKSLKSGKDELELEIKEFQIELNSIKVLDSTDLRRKIDSIIKTVRNLKERCRSAEKECYIKDILLQKIEMSKKEKKRLNQFLDREVVKTSEPIVKGCLLYNILFQHF